MKIYIHKLFFAVIAALFVHGGFSQSSSFYHLTTANGLYDNDIRSLAIDKAGFLWIGTEESLNRFDGQNTTVYLKERYSGLPGGRISNLFSDEQNRLWIGGPGGASWIDRQQRIHRLTVADTIRDFETKGFLQTPFGIIIITDKGHYLFDEKKQLGVYLDLASKVLPGNKVKVAQSYHKGKGLFVVDSTVLLYDYTSEHLTKVFTSVEIRSVCKRKNNDIVIGLNGRVVVFDVKHKAVKHHYPLQVDGLLTNLPQPAEIKEADDGSLVVATGFEGLLMIDTAGNVTQHLHNPVSRNSLIGNNVYRVATGANGEVIAGTSTSGISMYNVRLVHAGYTGFFVDDKNNYYDNYTGRMLAGKNHIIWIGAYDRLIKWNRSTNRSDFYFYRDEKDLNSFGDIRAMCQDKQGQLWVSIDKKGLFSFSEREGFKSLGLDSAILPAFGATGMPDMLVDEEGLVWVCTNSGAFVFNPLTRKPEAIDHPIIKTLRGQSVQSVFIDRNRRKWFTTLHNGVFCFEDNGKLWRQFTVKDGLPSDITYITAEDSHGNHFVTTNKGLAFIHPDGKIETITRQQGLRYDRCESVIVDTDNNVWFSNKKCLIKLNPKSKQLQVFDEKEGLQNNGFRVGSCLRLANGELLWGGYRGISYFFPRKLKSNIIPLQVNIYAAQFQDSMLDISHGLNLSYGAHSLSIAVAGMHLGIPGKTYFRYRLQGFDKDWQTGENLQTVRYTSLPPGEYVFELKGSVDGIIWIDAPTKLPVIIRPPIWMRWWAVALAAISFAVVIYSLMTIRNRKLRLLKEEQAADEAINAFAASLHDHQSTEAILWDVTRNCIGRLGFEDCVVYLIDEEKNVLIQKAAYGPKSQSGFQIDSPLQIPIGKGIVGTVASTRRPEIINDTSKDDRYIVDDERRYSEIAVPLIWGEKVIGVLDCEHRERKFFTQKHLSLLSTIASLCANKIIRAKAEEEKRKAQEILSDTQQKMAEAEMQALRAQMNPHFIFNCLNSINRYILKSDEATASLYLTRFAKLIRLILDNSGNKNVSLSNELEALRLYIEMEALRFDKKFRYEIIVHPNVNADSIEVPPLIIQPYVENAIWHGLLHKEGEGVLNICIGFGDEGMLKCIIEDNGIGRAKAKEVKSKSATQRKSLGMQLTERRIALLNKQTTHHASVSIVDKEDEQKKPAGTKVILYIPV